MKKVLLFVSMLACTDRADLASSGQPTPSFCQDGDTACQCAKDPSLPECGDLPNPYDIGAQPTLDYAVSQMLTPDADKLTCSNLAPGVVHCATSAHFLGHIWFVSCDLEEDIMGQWHKTCHAGIAPAFTSSFCADGDTACQCARNPGGAGCDQPNTIEQQMAAETSEQAAALTGGYLNPADVSIVNNTGLVRTTVGIFMIGSLSWRITCTYTYSADLKSHTTHCTATYYPT